MLIFSVSSLVIKGALCMGFWFCCGCKVVTAEYVKFFFSCFFFSSFIISFLFLHFIARVLCSSSQLMHFFFSLNTGAIRVLHYYIRSRSCTPWFTALPCGVIFKAATLHAALDVDVSCLIDVCWRDTETEGKRSFLCTFLGYVGLRESKFNCW